MQVLDGQGKVEISEPGGLEPISISVVPGKHRIRVEKEGFVAITDNIEIASGGTLDIKARLVPKPGKGPVASGQGPAKSWETPAFQAWMKFVASLSGEKQVEAVSKKLVELNPGFDGKTTPYFEGRVVTRLQFLTNNVADISPVRALVGLKVLACHGNNGTQSEFSDLSPLNGMQLTSFGCSQSQVSDLTPLKGMPLSTLYCHVSRVADLSPVQGMPLTDLNISNTAVSDLSPLKGMKLTLLNCGNTKITEVSILKGMPLTAVYGMGPQVSDISPLEDCKSLKTLNLRQTKVTAASVAALQRALPNCKIEWDDPARATAANGPVVEAAEIPADDWIGLPQCWKITQQEITGSAAPATGGWPTYLCSKNVYRNFELSCQVRLIHGDTGIQVRSNYLDQARFKLRGPQVDIGPTQGWGSLFGQDWPGLSKRVSNDLSQRKPDGFNEVSIRCVGKHLTIKINGQTTVDDDITNMPDEGLIGFQLYTKDTEVVYRHVSVTELDEFGKPAARNQPWETPAFQQWMKDVAALPAEKQVEAVSKKLMELNPGFDGKITNNYLNNGAPKIENGVVTKVGIVTDNVTDISPLRALAGLRSLNCSGSSQGKGRLSDLSPLKGMSLTSLVCGASPISDLSPLAGMRLTYLICGVSRVSDLSPLKGMPLAHLNCSSSPVSDLSPLQGMPLTQLDCYGTKVFDLSPLQGAPLTILSCGATKVADLSPLAGMPLKSLYCYYTPVSDLSPLAGMNLTDFQFSPKRIAKGLEVVRQMKSLKTIGVGTGQPALPAAEFWKKYDVGEFGQPAAPAKLAYLDPAFEAWMKSVAAMPAEKQVEAVSKKLMELNPGFDGKVMPRIVNDAVIGFEFLTENVTDISPVRALAGLKVLDCRGGLMGIGKLSDLSPLNGMQMTTLECSHTSVSDLSPLRDMPLKVLWLGATQISDLSPLAGMRLTLLACDSTKVSDLSPLRGMPLNDLKVNSTQVSDLSPLEGCQSLESLHVKFSKVTPAAVAVFVRALPNCKIDWDGKK